MTARAVFGYACLAAMCVLVSAPAAAAEEAERQPTASIGGQLLVRGSGKPLAGATVRFVPEDPERAVASAVTDAQGGFAVDGLAFGTYTVEIENAEGAVVRAAEARPVDEGGRIVLELARSERLRSMTTVEVGPGGATASVVRERMSSRRFWKQFAIFWGVTIATGAAAY